MDASLKISGCAQGGQAPNLWCGRAAWGESSHAGSLQHHEDQKRLASRSQHRAWPLGCEKFPAVWTETKPS